MIAERAVSLVNYSKELCKDPGSMTRYIEECEYRFVDEDRCSATIDLKAEVCDEKDDKMYLVWKRVEAKYSPSHRSWSGEVVDEDEEYDWRSCSRVRTVNHK